VCRIPCGAPRTSQSCLIIQPSACYIVWITYAVALLLSLMVSTIFTVVVRKRALHFCVSTGRDPPATPRAPGAPSGRCAASGLVLATKMRPARESTTSLVDLQHVPFDNKRQRALVAARRRAVAQRSSRVEGGVACGVFALAVESAFGERGKWGVREPLCNAGGLRMAAIIKHGGEAPE
jgi:hypothetical protein